MMQIADRQFDAYQAFVLDCKLFWTNRIFPQLYAMYRERADAFAATNGRQPRDAGEVARLLDGDPLTRNFNWLERHMQRLKYSGRWGLSPAYAARRGDVDSELASAPAAMLKLDPDFRYPDYYTAVDIHQHPGGVWSDSTAAHVYERGARTTTPLMSRDKDLHYRFTDLVLGLKKPQHLLDLGCGFGKSTKPFYESLRDAEIVGVDLAEPGLRFAARDAAQAQARNTRFVQGDAAHTGLPDRGFDVVTSTMLLHEMPPPVIRDLIAESHRVLQPGGVAVHLDFLPPDDPFLTYIHYGHGQRNNEPYMEPLAKMNIVKAMEEAGFRNVRAMPFEEMPGALAGAHQKWRFPWTVIVGEKA